MRNGTAQPTNARAFVPYVRPQACLEACCLPCKTLIGCLQHWRRCAAQVKYLCLTSSRGQLVRWCCVLAVACLQVVLGMLGLVQHVSIWRNRRQVEAIQMLEAPKYMPGRLPLSAACLMALAWFLGKGANSILDLASSFEPPSQVVRAGRRRHWTQDIAAPALRCLCESRSRCL